MVVRNDGAKRGSPRTPTVRTRCAKSFPIASPIRPSDASASRSGTGSSTPPRARSAPTPRCASRSYARTRGPTSGPSGGSSAKRSAGASRVCCDGIGGPPRRGGTRPGGGDRSPDGPSCGSSGGRSSGAGGCNRERRRGAASLAAARRAARCGRTLGGTVTPRGTDWSLASLVALGFATGALTVFSGAPGDAWVFAVHGTAGIALAAVLVWKLRRVGRRLAPHRWERRTVAGAAALLLVGAALGSGWAWASGARVFPGGYSLLVWHGLLGAALGALVLTHALVRAKRP